MEDLGGDARVCLGDGQERNEEQQQGWTEESQERLARDTTDLNRKVAKEFAKITKKNRPRIFTDSHG